MKIGELSQHLGLPASTIRYYEKEGLIDPPLRQSGQRQFAPKAIKTLEFIQIAQAGGFSIAEIKTLLKGYGQRSRLADAWYDLARAKKKDVHRQMEHLRAVDRVLDQLLACDCETLEDCVERASIKGKKQK